VDSQSKAVMRSWTMRSDRGFASKEFGWEWANQADWSGPRARKEKEKKRKGMEKKSKVGWMGCTQGKEKNRRGGPPGFQPNRV
jgi:hypothetical protein